MSEDKVQDGFDLGMGLLLAWLVAGAFVVGICVLIVTLLVATGVLG